MSCCCGIPVSTQFAATLSGNEEVPPAMTQGRGSATFRQVSANSLSFAVDVQDLRRITEAHVHKGRRGENGPIVAWLFGPSRGTDVSGLLARGTIRRGDLVGPLRGRRIRDLIHLMQRGQAYVNVHTVDNPQGEIRGQIRSVQRAPARTGESISWREGSWTIT